MAGVSWTAWVVRESGEVVSVFLSAPLVCAARVAAKEGLRSVQSVFAVVWEQLPLLEVVEGLRIEQAEWAVAAVHSRVR